MQLTPRISPSQGLKDVSRRMSLQLKLPLLMSAVLVVVLGTALVVTYTTLRRTAIARATDQLSRATRQLATLGATTIPTQQARFAVVTNDSAVRRALAAPSSSPAGTQSPAVTRALEKLVLPVDSGRPVELWSADGRRIAYVGRDVRGNMTVERGKPELPLPSVTQETASPLGTRDSLRLGPLYAEPDGVYFWFVMPVREAGRSLGFITQQRKLALGANAVRTLRELSGDSVSLYYRNADTSFWASGLGLPSAGLSDADPETGTARDSTGEEVLFHEERIGSTQLVVGMSIPTRMTLIRPRSTITTVLLLSLVLLAGGVGAAWLIGRSVSRPLADITDAAGRLAAGDYGARVPTTGEQEVRRLAETFNHMAAEIGASRSALERQTREAQDANNAKSDFLTTMSHELRTPLNAIGGYVDLIEMELRGPITEAQRRDLQRIKASQEHLLGLISSVLDLSRIESGQVAYTLVHLAVDPFLASIDALVAPQATTKSVQLEYHQCAPDCIAIADREKLRQIVLNLLSNAIRHTPAGGAVKLWAERRGSRIAIMVEDTGPGIPADKHEVIFEPFVQLDRSLTQTMEGLGLGLAISRDLARGMQGDLVVEPSDRGARFALTLPRGSVEAAAEALAVSGEMPAQPPVARRVS